MAKNKLVPFLLLASFSVFSFNSFAMDVALQGKIVAIESDGTLWLEAADDYSEEYKQAAEHVMPNYTRIHYNMLRFHVHGQEMGYLEYDSHSPHAQAQRYAADLMKKFTDRPAKVFCVELNRDRTMPSCIAEVDGTDVARFLVQEGYAETKITEKTPEEYKALLLKDEEKAKDQQIGIWSSMQGLFSKSIK